MKSTEFAYWLQGLFELANPKTLDERQTDLIKRHLNMVFLHDIDQSYPEEQQQQLNEIHSGQTPHKHPTPKEMDLTFDPLKVGGIPNKTIGLPNFGVNNLHNDPNVGADGNVIDPTKPVMRC